MDLTNINNLEEYLDDLEAKSTIVEPPSSIEEPSSCIEEPPKSLEADDNAWMDIQDCMNDWTKKVIDSETRSSRSKNYLDVVEESLDRQVKDGLISYREFVDLQYIGKLWARVLNTTAAYTLGADYSKRDVITTLLDLYTLKQISTTSFVEAVLKL